MTLTNIADYNNVMFRAERQGQRILGFGVVLTHHRTWGTILLPYTFEKEPGRRFASIKDTLSPYPGTDILGTLAPEEREVVKLINDYSEKRLFRLFSKDTNARKFVETLTKDKFESLIRPYIEAKMFKVLTILQEEGIPIFQQKLKSTNFHSDDLLTVCQGEAEGIFRFCRTMEGTKYSLSVIYNEQEIKLFNTATEVIINNPCVIRSDNRVIFVRALDSAKLRPFLTREYLTIPASAEDKYYSTFVLNAVTNFRFEAEGFDVVTGEPSRKPLLLVESTLKGVPAIIISYSYSGTVIYDNDARTTFTRFKNDKGSFIFKRLLRDRDWEMHCRSVLEDLGFYSEDNIHFTVFRGNGTQGDDLPTLIEAINRSYEDLIKAGFEIRQGSLDNKYHLGNVTIRTGYTMENDWFDLKAEVQIGEYIIPFVRFRRNIMEGIREYKLPDGSFAILPETWFTAYRDVFGFGKEENDSLKIHKQHFPVISQALGEGEGNACSNLERLIMPDKLPATPLPMGLDAEMRPYQEEGFNWMMFLQANKLGGCLADDMGLGKTIQALAMLLHNKEQYNEQGDAGDAMADIQEVAPGSPENLFSGQARKLTNLIIVPASLLHNWENEIRMYTPALKVYTYKGIGRRKSNSYFGFYDIILSSYHTVRQDIDIMGGFRFHYIILDESQVIKNPGSAVYKAISRLRSNHKIVLTGTPVENSLTDLWTQMNFVNPGLLGSLIYFRNEFARPIERNLDRRQEEKLKAIIKPFILRRTKEMVATELPPVWEQMVYCDMTDEQATVYEREKSAIRNSIMGTMEENEEENQAIMVLQGLMKLRQIANHPLMAIDEYGEGSGKFDIVLHDIKSVTKEGHKILIFSSFVKHLNLYAGALNRENIRFSMLTGSTVNREEVVKGFQNDPSRKVFLISLKAGGVGLNLTAADYVFILDPWWNPAAEMQALNRAHRIGQDKNVFVFRYISAATIEEKI
ncbi:MAG: ATP-dependent helicase, partial [Bacteroidales bacterium]|nr:ATP-dependent helicase [Bacteroidales bacterium]